MPDLTLEQITQALVSWELAPKCPDHDLDVASIASWPSEVRQFSYCDVEYECGCRYHRTPFVLEIVRVCHA
jgi:hypothetical protein